MAVDNTAREGEAKTLFLLGAGASYGHRESPGADTPPLMRDFLPEAAVSGDLNDVDFPQLALEIRYMSGEPDLLKGCQALRDKTDLEAFLDLLRQCSQDEHKQDALREIQSEMHKQMRREGRSTREYLDECHRLPNPDFALETSRYLIQSFIGRYCMTPMAEGSAYAQLAKFVKKHADCVTGILTLNYDTLCEKALDSEGIGYHYSFSAVHQGSLCLLKPHGSVNFRYPIGRLMVMDTARDWRGYIRSANTTIQNATIRGFGPQAEVYCPKFSLQDDFWTGPDQPIGYMPMLVQPFKDKLYDQLPDLAMIWRGVEEALARTDRLVVVGCRMRPSEARLWDRIRKYLKSQATIRIVDCGDKALVEVEEVFRTHGFVNTQPLHGVKGFHAYALDYLGAGHL